jgi:hypothetical protein
MPSQIFAITVNMGTLRGFIMFQPIKEIEIPTTRIAREPPSSASTHRLSIETRSDVSRASELDRKSKQQQSGCSDLD